MSDSRQLLEKSWRLGWRKPDRRPIADWAYDNIYLPPAYAQPGRLDFKTSRHCLKPLAAVQSDAIREASWCGAIQTGKSLIVEAALAWAACNSPGPIMWTMQTDEDAKEQCNQRTMEMLMSVPQIRAMLPPDRHKATMTEIYFGPFFLMVNGANLNNLQRVSIRWKFNSEVWLWKQGLQAHARGRVSAFEKAGNSKVINESQGGTEGDDFHKTWDEGTREDWAAKCFGCGLHSPLAFEGKMTAEPSKRACVVWNDDARRDDGTWNIARACETVRWICPNCGKDHEDTARTRARWNLEGDYLGRNPSCDPTKASYRWEALVARPMADLAAQFLSAREAQKRGVTQAMQDFTRQRRALPWRDDDMTETITLRAGGYLLSSETITAKIDNEVARFLTVDRQRDHFWVLARAWRADGSSRLLYRSRIQTEPQINEVEKKFGLEPQLVFEDAGYFPNGVYSDCAKYGWTALKGSGDNYFNAEVRGVKIRRMFSSASRIEHDGKLIPLIHWASDPIKDVLYLLRTGKGAAWECADDAGEDYQKQLNGDRKKPFLNKKTGREEWRWQRVGPNHYADCEAMQVAAALMLNILAAPEIPEQKEVAT